MREDLGNDEIIGRFGENPGKNTGKALGCMGKICDFFHPIFLTYLLLTIV